MIPHQTTKLLPCFLHSSLISLEPIIDVTSCFFLITGFYIKATAYIALYKTSLSFPGRHMYVSCCKLSAYLFTTFSVFRKIPIQLLRLLDLLFNQLSVFFHCYMLYFSSDLLFFIFRITC